MKSSDPEVDLAYLCHIRDSAVTIAGYLKGIDESTFQNTRLVQDGAIRQLQIIGEATKKWLAATGDVPTLLDQVLEMLPDAP
jgi:uncharacterized protein with HEPN domain